jgi:hypothetical protein
MPAQDRNPEESTRQLHCSCYARVIQPKKGEAQERRIESKGLIITVEIAKQSHSHLTAVVRIDPETCLEHLSSLQSRDVGLF